MREEQTITEIPKRFRTRTKAKPKRGCTPPSAWGPYQNKETGPSLHESRCTAWGFLLAAAWFGNGAMEPPTAEYLEVFADLHGLAVPGFAEVGLGGEEVLG